MAGGVTLKPAPRSICRWDQSGPLLLSTHSDFLGCFTVHLGQGLQQSQGKSTRKFPSWRSQVHVSLHFQICCYLGGSKYTLTKLIKKKNCSKRTHALKSIKKHEEAFVQNGKIFLTQATKRKKKLSLRATILAIGGEHSILFPTCSCGLP